MAVIRDWRLWAIFGFALALRLTANLAFLEHRVCHFGDAFYFLTTGHKLLLSLTGGGGLENLGRQLAQSNPQAAGGMGSMLSMSLVDRLLIDGPVYPAYLAFVEWAGGHLGPDYRFDAHCLKYSLFNSILDSGSVALVYIAGRLAFNRTTAVIAAILFAVYPPAIINTQRCYSEQLSYFLLLVWLSLLFAARLKVNAQVYRISSWLALGVATGLLMLTRSTFVLLPPLSALVVVAFALARKGIRFRAWAFRSALLLFGMSVILAPWFLFSSAATGKGSFFVKRVPTFNLIAGNQLSNDGWTVNPFRDYVPGTSGEAAEIIGRTIEKSPASFISLQIRKLPRLWAGEWNELSYTCLGVPAFWQQVFHQILLIFAFIGLLNSFMAGSRLPFSRIIFSSTILAVVVLFHFSYCFFEPISRYNVTAMPAVCLLAAFACSESLRKERLKETLLFALFAVFILLVLRMPGGFLPCLAGIVSRSWFEVAYWLNGGAWFAVWLALGGAAVRMMKGDRREQICRIVCGSGFAAAGLIAFVYALSDPARSEWTFAVDKPGQAVSRQILLPENLNPAERIPFVLVDLNGMHMPPEIRLSVNGHATRVTPVPWLQLRGKSATIVEILQLQAEAMGADLKTFRQWWALPVDGSLLKPGEVNRISVAMSNGNRKAQFRVYGSYPESNDGRVVSGRAPSVTAESWTKGFATYFAGDARIAGGFECDVAGPGRSDGGYWKDRSPSQGMQFGQPRIYLLFLSGKVPDEGGRAFKRILVSDKLVKRVSGDMPQQMMLTPEPLELSGPLAAGTRMSFSVKVWSTSRPGAGYVSLSMSGKKDGETVSWSSPWQPAGFDYGANWHYVSFADAIPDNIAGLDRIEVSVMVVPFLQDQLFLKRKKALRSEMQISDAVFELSPGYLLPPPEKRDWRIY